MSFVANHPCARLVPQLTAGGHPISVIVAFPQALQDAGGAAVELSSSLLDFAGLGPLGELLRKIGFAKGLGYSIARRGDAFPVELVAVMKDEEAAGLVSGTLNLLKGLALSLPQSADDREAIRPLEDLSVEREGEILTIRFVMTERDLAR